MIGQEFLMGVFFALALVAYFEAMKAPISKKEKWRAEKEMVLVFIAASSAMWMSLELEFYIEHFDEMLRILVYTILVLVYGGVRIHKLPTKK